MRRPQRLIAAAVLVALSGALAGCGGGGLGNFDPSDLLDFLDTKKKLPGERKPVFPDGVPGLDQGVPKDLYKGARQQQVDDPNAQAAAPPPAEPKSKRGAKGKQAAAPAAAEPDAAPEEEGSTAAAPPAPKPQKVARKRTTAPPPDQSAAPAQQSAAPFPAPMPSGSFTR
jgi:predicted small lipoprotein YifL